MATESEHLLERRARVVPRGISRISRIVPVRGEGAFLEDAEGRRYVDLAGGIGVMSVGHNHPEVVAAVREQSERLLHTCFAVATYEPYVALCERLAELLPHGPATKVMLANTGAEAVENAVKIARQATGRPGILCFTGGFHGRTLLGMSLTSKVGYKLGCGPFAPEIHRLPFPDLFRAGAGLSEEVFVARELGRLRDALSSVVAPRDLAAILVEIVQGEGGFATVPPAWLRGVRELCDEHGILLILDEVQTGFCRTGSWGAYQQLGVVPDLSTWAKAMGGGLPISAVVGRAEVMDAALPGTIGGTYGGNPVACAAALATLRVMERERLSERAIELGARMREKFEAMRARCPAVVDVRGMGAMLAFELCEGGDPARPAGALTAEVLAACHARGVLVIGAGVHGNVVRILCPLVIEPDVLDRALDTIVEEVTARCR